MPVDQLTDDYVAALLAEDAKKSSKNYTSYGLQALLPKRSANNVAKPNTRFLKNIIRETDSHNATLKAREVQESHERLKKLGRSNGETVKHSSGEGKLKNEDEHRSKRRRIDQINGILGGRSKDGEKPRSNKDEHSRSHRHRHRRRNSEDQSEVDEEMDDNDEERRSHERRRSHQHGHRRRSGDESDDLSRADRKERRPKRRQRSRSRSSSPRKDNERRRRRHGSHNRIRRPRSRDDHKPATQTHPRSPSSPTKTKPQRSSSSSDSDPLESLGLIGPSPPPKHLARGRGTFTAVPDSRTAATTMDQHFSSNYDPTLDVQPDADGAGGDDWDQALEALRDRQKWRQNQADRMRGAGFTEEEIGRWEKGGRKEVDGGKGEEGVRWRERGEGREWDRGKEGLDWEKEKVEGVEWGRLKGT